MPNIDYNKITKKLSKLKCPEHHKSATIIVKEENGPIVLNCSCLEFEEYLNDMYYNEIDIQLAGE